MTCPVIYLYNSCSHCKNTNVPLLEPVGQTTTTTTTKTTTTTTTTTTVVKNCGEDFHDISSGSISSPNYPQTYPSSSYCVWHIDAKAGKQVDFTFNHMDLEDCSDCACDYIELRDGPDESSPVIAKKCGNSLPGGEFVSTGEQMTVIFRSDGRDNFIGFDATFDELKHNT